MGVGDQSMDGRLLAEELEFAIRTYPISTTDCTSPF